MKRKIQRPMGSIGFVGLECDYVNYIFVYIELELYFIYIYVCVSMYDHTESYFIIYS